MLSFEITEDHLHSYGLEKIVLNTGFINIKTLSNTKVKEFCRINQFFIMIKGKESKCVASVVYKS